MTTPLARVLRAIDAANSADPTIEESQPAALLYGQRMSAELERLVITSYSIHYTKLYEMPS